MQRRDSVKCGTAAMRQSCCCCALFVIGFVICSLSALSAPAWGGSPLRVHPDNPRYFTDDGAKAIYLAGHQWFNDLQHAAWDFPVQVDWDHYLDFLEERKLNYLRSWIIWSVGDPTSGRPAPLMPFKRTGPDNALDGKPKFDLHQFDPDFFELLREQVAKAQRRRVYVSVMLFEVYGFMDRQRSYPKSFWAGNVWHGPNNINAIDVDENGNGHGLEFFFTSREEVLQLQRAYVKRVIDAVSEYDNVLFEIANELDAGPWQHEMVRYVKDYEVTKPKQHLVYMSPGGRDRNGKWSLLPKQELLSGPADVYSVAGGWDRHYRGDPPVEQGLKPVFMDMDHVAAGEDGDNDWNNHPATPWKLLTRGYHQCLYDHDYWKPGAHREKWDRTRYSIGATVTYANRMNLARMHPRNDLSSTTYCLADPGREYLVFQPGTGNVRVLGLRPGYRYRFEWFDTEKCRAGSAGLFTAAASTHQFETPFASAVLYLVLGPIGE